MKQFPECEKQIWTAKAEFGVRKAEFGVRKQVSECESASLGKPENFFPLKSEPEFFL